MKRLFLALAPALGLVLAAGPAAHAQTLEDRLRAQLVSVTAELRALQAKTAAQPGGDQDAGLKAKLAAAEAEVRALRKRPRAAAPAEPAAPLKAQLQAVAQARAESDAALAALRDANARLTAEAGQRGADDQRLKAEALQETQALGQCQARNAQAIQVAKYILAAYRQVSIADVLARKEPVAGIGRVRIEQLEQRFGDDIHHSRLDAQPRPAAPVPPAPPAPAQPQ